MRIMIRATNWVGDAIMALPALRAVRAKFPDAQISVVARSYVADLYRDQSVCDDLIPYDTKGPNRGWRGRESMVALLRARQFDVALLLQNAFDAAWLAWRAHIPERIGYARDGRSLLLTRSVAVPRQGEILPHEVFYYLELLRRAGWIDGLDDVQQITLRVPDAQRHRAMQKLVEAGARPNAIRIAVGAGASYGSAKCWPPDRFAQALNEFRSQVDADLILFGTPQELPVSSAIARELSFPCIDLTGKTSVAELPSLLSQCHIFLGNDSGAMHIAASVGLPVVAVFGPTDPQGTAPVTPRVQIVQQKPYCSPCFLRRCPTDHRCMRAVTPNMVVEALQRALPPISVGQ
ncbi:MAG TPA: lipopolysaccharide heptosyltransferase II [Dongiaceae bacterium]|nr:lipopolysaccharide heptosyltransferase II [Dongiaceae bacterium]